jgi:hypothetical protein
MKTIKVTFLDSTHNYYTSVNSNASKESLEKYFVNQLFDVGIYPNEDLYECISIEICNYYYVDKKGFKVGFENLTLNGIYILKGFQNDSDRGKVCIHRNNELTPVCDFQTDQQVKLEDLNEVIFPDEREKLRIEENWLCWADKTNLYCFDNNDNLRLLKNINETDNILSKA